MLADELRDALISKRTEELLTEEKFLEKYSEVVAEIREELFEMAKRGFTKTTIVLEDELSREMFLNHSREFEKYTGLNVFPVSLIDEVDIYW